MPKKCKYMSEQTEDGRYYCSNEAIKLKFNIEGEFFCPHQTRCRLTNKFKLIDNIARLCIRHYKPEE